MSRKYCCDRCGAEFTSWSTASIEIPATTFTSKVNFDLCQPCLGLLRNLVQKFKDNHED